jgi:hypothetical protein
MAAKLDQIIDKYLKIRDEKTKIKEKYQADVAHLDAAMEKIENYLQAEMQKSGLKNLPTELGTAYLSTRTAATVADWDSLLSYVRANDLWTLLEKRVSKTAVEEFVAANDDLPPGVNISQAVVVNVRRS